MRRALLVAAAAVLLAGAMGLAVLVNLPGAGAESPRATVRRRDVDIRLIEYGEVVARDVQSILAPISGEVIWVPTEGTEVKVGDPVIKINSEDLEVQLEEDRRAGVGLEGRLEVREKVAKATAAENAAAVRRAEIDLELAKERLAEAKGHPTAEERRRAELDLAAARLQARRADAEESALAQLAKDGFTSAARAKAARLAMVRAHADLAKATAAHREITSGVQPQTIRALESAVKNAEMALAQARFSAEVDTMAAEQEVEVARTRLEVHKKRLDDTARDIASAAAPSPISGVVALVDVWKGGTDLSPVQVGETHHKGREMLKVADISSLRVAVFVNERDVVRLREGQTAAARLVANPGRSYPAKVAEIEIFADDKNRQLGSLAMEKLGEAGVNVVKVLLDLEVPAGAAAPRLGSSAEVDIVLEHIEAALTVPLKTLAWEDGKAWVQVVRGNRAQRVAVEVAGSTEDEAVIAAGLAEGESVLLQTSAGRDE